MFEPDKYKGGQALVIGAGKSGIACANLLAANGFRVLLSESRPRTAPGIALKGLDRAVTLETGRHTNRILDCSFAVKSPGLARTSPVIKTLRKHAVPVFSEVEVALAFSKTRNLMAVTGTNGKTTTTVLLGGIMRRSLAGGGARALVCGNVGIPASRLAPKARETDFIVMELSSYQLEDSSYLKPAVSCVLNVTPDHLDHHGGPAAYLAAKARIFRSQEKNDFCVFNYEDRRCRELARRCRAEPLFFSAARRGGNLNAYVEKDGGLAFRLGTETWRFPPPALPGTHNLENAMCAGLMALAAGAEPAALKKVFAGFKGVEHRLETVRTLSGVRYINDSKATNVDSTLVALKALGSKKNIHLILGGLDKGCPYAPLKPLLKKYVREVLTIGSAASKIEKELAGACRFIPAKNLKTAVSLARKNSAGGDLVLLSPACASFDQFRDYEDRGRRFKELAKKLG